MVKRKLTIVFRVEIATLSGPDGRISPLKMDRLAMTVSNLRNSGKNLLIVSSGAIVLGSEKLGQATVPGGRLEMQAAAAVGQAELIRYYQSYFDDYNQIIAQVLITSDIVNYRQRVDNAGNTFTTLLDMNIIPIVNENDPVSTADIDLNDNYPLALIVAGIAGADIIVVKRDKDDQYLIIPGNGYPASVVDGETSLLAEINSLQEIMKRSPRAHPPEFPRVVEEICTE